MTKNLPKFLFWIHILLTAAIFNSCYQSGGEMSPPPLPGSLAHNTQALRDNYERSCKELKLHCDAQSDTFCSSFYDLISTSYCKASVGDRAGANSACSCSDVCKPEELSELPIKDLSNTLNDIKGFNGGKTFDTTSGYALLKSLSARMSFSPSNEALNSKVQKKVEAMKVIESLQSGAYLGGLKSFNGLSDIMSFIDGDPVLKSRFLNTYQSTETPKPVLTEGESPVKDGNYNGREGDLLKFRGQYFSIDKNSNGDLCVKSLEGEDTCASPISQKLPLNQTRKVSVNYSPQELTKVHTSCVIKTECSNPPSHLNVDKAKVTFTPDSSLSGGYKENFDEVTECVRKIGGSPKFQQALKANPVIGRDRGEQIFRNLNQREMNIRVSANWMKCGGLLGSTTVAKATANVPRIKLNSCLKNKSKASTVNTLLHEYLHVLGYITNPHTYKSSGGDYIYQTGLVAESMTQSMCGF